MHLKSICVFSNDLDPVDRNVHKQINTDDVAVSIEIMPDGTEL